LFVPVLLLLLLTMSWARWKYIYVAGLLLGMPAEMQAEILLE
jgi:hypothetical protein